MKLIYVISAVVLTIMLACGPSQPQLAVKKIADAEALLARGDTANCLLQLDSISLLYPKALSEAKNALQIRNRLCIRINAATRKPRVSQHSD